MDSIRQYLISITAAAIICAIAKSFADGKTLNGTMLRLIAGIIMTVTLLSPLVQLDFHAMPELTAGVIHDANAAAAFGEEMATAEITAIINDRLEAYILDKAACLGANLEVQLQMGTDGSYLPEGIILSGDISPYAKARLQQIIANDIQIAKEKQQWIS